MGRYATERWLLDTSQLLHSGTPCCCGCLQRTITGSRASRLYRGYQGKSPPFPEELLILNSCLVRDAIFFRYVASYTTPLPMMGQEILFNLLDHTQEKTKKQEGFFGKKVLSDERRERGCGRVRRLYSI